MADISAKITKKSLAAKRKSAIKTIKAQAREKIREINIQYAENPRRSQSKEAAREQSRLLKLQQKNARISYNYRQPRQYSTGEELFNSISHGIGAGLGVAAIVLLVLRAVMYAPVGMQANYVFTFTLFGASLFIMYMVSTLFHSLTPYGARKVFSILDHIGMYLLIGGTFTPFVITCIPGPTGIVLFIAGWALIVVLSTLYAVFGDGMRDFASFTYLILGWLTVIVFAIYPMGHSLPKISEVFLITGAISYTVGSLFDAIRNYKWTHSICHVFTLFGSILHFFSVYYSIGLN